MLGHLQPHTLVLAGITTAWCVRSTAVDAYQRDYRVLLAQDAMAAFTERDHLDQVRVLRVTYNPGEKSVMHEHPNAVAVFLTEVQGQFTFPDGKTQAMTTKAGQPLWTPAGKHLPENIGAKPFELILVVLKSKPATTKKN